MHAEHVFLHVKPPSIAVNSLATTFYDVQLAQPCAMAAL
jgi:hypothetical protein